MTSRPPFDPEAAKPGFEVARKLADPDFRARLTAAGHADYRMEWATS